MANATESFNQKLMTAMKQMENPTKSKKATVPTKSGKEYSYNYESLDQVLEVVRPALAENGLMLVQGIRWHEQSAGYVLETGAMDENETRILDTRPMPQCDDAQAEGSWETYKRRYALRTAFGLAAEDDDGAATLSNPPRGNFDKPMSDKQQGMLMSLISEFADLRGKTNEEVIDALMATKAMDGAIFESLTSKQASEAIKQMIVWKEKAENTVQEDAELADTDYEF